jgi:hypothetical protein
MGWDIYGTHVVPLGAAIARAPMGPVLELGMGEGSTPFLHALCHNRLLVSAETDAVWAKKFEQFASPMHGLHQVQDWATWPVVEQMHRWAVALVDCAPGEARAPLIARLANRCTYILAHDSEKDYGVGTDYRYEGVTPLFKYVSEYRYLRPYTLILSNFQPFTLDEVEKIWTPLT